MSAAYSSLCTNCVVLLPPLGKNLSSLFTYRSLRSCPKVLPRAMILSCTSLKWLISSLTKAIISCTSSVYSGNETIREIAVEAAFCSQKAWSERISSIFISTILTHLGSVGNLSPNIRYRDQKFYAIVQDQGSYPSIFHTSRGWCTHIFALPPHLQ